MVDNVNVSAITTPEPTTMALLALRMIPIATLVRRRRS